MDGTNVNLKFYRDFVQDRLLQLSTTCSLVDIGVCNLHVVHGAFRTGVVSTGWKLSDLLKALEYLFADTFTRGNRLYFCYSSELRTMFTM